MHNNFKGNLPPRDHNTPQPLNKTKQILRIGLRVIALLLQSSDQSKGKSQGEIELWTLRKRRERGRIGRGK